MWTHIDHGVLWRSVGPLHSSFHLDLLPGSPLFSHHQLPETNTHQLVNSEHVSVSHTHTKKSSRVCILPVVPVLHLVDVKLRHVHVLGLPGRLVVRQLSPLDQVVDVVLPVHAEETQQRGELS